MPLTAKILVLIVPILPIVPVVSVSVPGCLHRRAKTQSGIKRGENEKAEERKDEFLEKEF
jgi:hypothetical protein